MKALTDAEMQHKPNILVVEDEEDMRQNLVELLSEEFKTFIAANGEEALRIFYNEQFRLNVVLLDIRLPDMTGIEILTRMKKINLAPDIIMVTALNDTETAVKAMKHGAYDYVTKPFYAGDLVATINRAIEKEDYHRKLKELTDRLDRERIAAEHRRLLFQELQMKRRVEGRDLGAEEKALFNFPVLSEEDYDYDKLKSKLSQENKEKIEYGEGANIIILENETELRDTLTGILSDNYTIEVASSGHEAFELMEKKAVDLLLLDVKTLDMNGLDILKRVKETHPNIDVIIVTPIRNIEDAIKAIKMGAYDYITKPLNQDELKASIERILEKRSSKKVLETLLNKYRDSRLSFEPRLNMLKELFIKRKGEKKKVTVEDVYTFFPEFQEGNMPVKVEVNFPDFKKEEQLDKYIRQLKSSAEKI
ncbi:response regulator [Candidatus Margulisiibacteriota bacterium]